MDWSDSDGETEVSFAMTDAAPTESHTSVSGASQRAPSPAPSIYSLTASLRQDLLVNVHGRTLNSSSEVYQLPADEEEIYRLGERRSRCLVANMLVLNFRGVALKICSTGCGRRPGEARTIVGQLLRFLIQPTRMTSWQSWTLGRSSVSCRTC